jgi:hypothetical protein
VSVAVLEVLPSVAVIDAVVFVLTAVVLTVNVAEVLPAGIVTVAGTVAEESLLDSEITSPPAGAIDPIRTVPVLGLPPLTEVGLKVSETRVGGLMVSVAVCETLPSIAVSVAAV